MRISAIKKLDCSNGDGIGVSIFCSGCKRQCKGCWNSELWSFRVGRELSEVMDEIIVAIQNPHINHISLLGGDFLDQDLTEVDNFLKVVVENTSPKNKIWMWTGHVWDNMYRSTDELDKTRVQIIEKYVDVLIDGPFVLGERNPKLFYRGSNNQKIYIKVNGNLVANVEMMNKLAL